MRFYGVLILSHRFSCRYLLFIQNFRFPAHRVYWCCNTGEPRVDKDSGEGTSVVPTVVGLVECVRVEGQVSYVRYTAQLVWRCPTLTRAVLILHGPGSEVPRALI